MKHIIASIVAALLFSATTAVRPVMGAHDTLGEQSSPKARPLNPGERSRFAAAKDDADAKIGALLAAHRIAGDMSFYVKDRPLYIITKNSEQHVVFQIGARILNERGAKWYLDGNRKEVFALVEECWRSALKAHGLSPYAFSISVDRGPL
jgi:hypothetical protein